MKVVLLSTRRLPPTYFDTVRADLGRPDVGLDVVGWVAPAGPVEGLVDSFTLIGPGRMPVAEPVSPAATDAAAGEVAAPAGEAAKAPAPEAVTEGDAATEASTVPEASAEAIASAAEAADADAKADAEGEHGAEGATATVPTAAATETPQPKPAAKPRPTGAKRVVKAVQWRARRLRKATGRVLPNSVTKPVKKLTTGRRSNNLAKTYWARAQGRKDVMAKIDQADVVIALDAGAVWAGWQLGQRNAARPVVLGVPAARRELDRLVGAGNG
jgi:hypothetical protein